MRGYGYFNSSKLVLLIWILVKFKANSLNSDENCIKIVYSLEMNQKSITPEQVWRWKYISEIK